MQPAEHMVVQQPKSFNFVFCGTQLSHMRSKGPGNSGLAIVDGAHAAKLSQSELLYVSGVGSKVKKGSYRPGQYQIEPSSLADQQSAYQPSWTRCGLFHNLYYRGMGFLNGSGEDNTIEESVKTVEHLLSQDKVGEKIKIRLAGYSRGAATAIRLANKLFDRFGDRVEVDLFLMDPVPGFGHESSRRKRILPPTVKNAYFTFSSDEKKSIYRSPKLDHYRFGPETKVSALMLPGSHQDQDVTPRDTDQPIAAQNNQTLVTDFFQGRDGLHETMLQKAGEVDINPGSPEAQKWHDSEGIKHLFNEMQSIPPEYSEFRKRTHQLFYELLEDYEAATKEDKKNKINSIAENAAICVESTNNYINNPQSEKVAPLKEKLKTFSSTAKLHAGKALSLRASQFCGVITGIVAGIFGATLGFIKGITNWRLAFIGGAIVSAGQTAAKKSASAFDGTYRTLTADVKEQEFFHAVQHVVKNKS